MNIVLSFIKRLIMSKRTLFNPSAERNKEPILQILQNFLPNYIAQASQQGRNTLRCLEISSGTGQHVVLFAQHFPSISFQPSEYDKTMFDSINGYIHNEEVQNVRPPIFIDVSNDYKLWAAPEAIEKSSIDIMININMIHISPFSCTEGLFKNAGQILRRSGFLFTYGPYGFHGKIFPDSNVRFNAGLQSQNPEWGVRDVDLLVKLASNVGLQLVETISMPANNHILVWIKE